MTSEIISIRGIPIAKARPRLSGKKAFNSQSQMQLATKWQLKGLIQGRTKIDSKVPIWVKLRFYMPIPQNLSQIKKKRVLEGFEKNVCRPDLDNLEKWILDCGNGILWEDDAQIYKLESEKMYCTNPRTEIEIIVYEKI